MLTQSSLPHISIDNKDWAEKGTSKHLDQYGGEPIINHIVTVLTTAGNSLPGLNTANPHLRRLKEKVLSLKTAILKVSYDIQYFKRTMKSDPQKKENLIADLESERTKLGSLLDMAMDNLSTGLGPLMRREIRAQMTSVTFEPSQDCRYDDHNDKNSQGGCHDCADMHYLAHSKKFQEENKNRIKQGQESTELYSQDDFLTAYRMNAEEKERMGNLAADMHRSEVALLKSGKQQEERTYRARLDDIITRSGKGPARKPDSRKLR